MMGGGEIMSKSPILVVEDDAKAAGVIRLYLVS